MTVDNPAKQTSYGPTFFVSVGLGAKSFTYATIVQLVGAIGALMAIFLTDFVGRRPLIITGATLLVIFDCMIAGFGTKVPHTDTANNVVVASFIMMLWSTKISWATHCCRCLFATDGVYDRR
jgi:MFS family permease